MSVGLIAQVSFIFQDDDGYVYIMSRTDDVINVAGHRLSTGAMEEVIASHPDVRAASSLHSRPALTVHQYDRLESAR